MCSQPVYECSNKQALTKMNSEQQLLLSCYLITIFTSTYVYSENAYNTLQAKHNTNE